MLEKGFKSMIYPTLDALELQDKTVFLRVDFNVSLDAQGNITDDSRIRAALPTILELQEKGAKIVLASHLGRPKGKVVKKYSLLPVAQRLAELSNTEVIFPEHCVGMEVKKLIAENREGKLCLLENLRFHSGEEANDDSFAEQLAELADVYVTDAFGALHRAHASTVGITKYIKEKAIGRLVEKEVNFLSKLLFEPQKPYVVILGGAKVSDKIGVIESLMNVADCFLIGGGMAYTFLKAQGVDVGSSLVEDTKLAVARKMLERAKIKGIKFLLPVDHLVASKFDNDAEQKVVDNKSDWDGFMGLDIGEKTVELYSEAISSAKNVFWNGPMGVFEFSNYKNGTNGIAKALTESKAMTVVGGGDSLSAINQSGFADKVTHLSTGGGASLNFLEGADLPGLKALL
jgi:phosphoglycerate kinase